MKTRTLLLATLPVALVGAACNAILGITDLEDPGSPDGGGSETSTPTGEGGTAEGGTVDGGGDGAAACGTPGGPNECTITIAQTEAIFPTWVLTFDEPVTQGINQVPATTPEYVAGAEPGTVTETHTGLTWQTSLLADGGSMSLQDAKDACAKLGPGWRLPTRIERTSIEYRGQPLATRTKCIPPSFRQDQPGYAWTTTPVPTDNGSAPTEMLIDGDDSCGLINVPLKVGDDGGANVYAARCVKGETKPAHFVINVANDTVLAVEQKLLWERTGTYVRTWAEANAHCNAKSMRVPSIQEAQGIVDPRTKDLFTAGVFVKPPNPTASTRALYSQTVLAVDPDGGLKTYEAISLLPPYGSANATNDEVSVDGKPVVDMLLRCVTTAP